ncbi:hypothetical protein NPX13_g188 [Xylaria arbuscula]|uniref:Uncharacterized protein n=1 Tax=Xylaria arbuscula TaxID=114810 RepID=A0A9W8NNP8_9PEZI|nr:hypothetical protein NPX13_g188 [Xylaria arbuscula]
MNPIFSPKKSSDNAVVDVEAIQGDDSSGDGNGSQRGSGDGSPEPKDSHGWKFRPPSDRLSPHQIFYIFVINGIGAAIVSGGINFAIAYALYSGKGTVESPIRLFQFPNTLAGDTAVTIFVQFGATWLIQSLLVNFDLRRGGVQPIGFLTQPKSRFLRWYMFLDQEEQTFEVRSLRHWLNFLVSQVVRSLIVAAIFFPEIFGVTIGFLTLVGEYDGGDWWYPALWTPELFKLVQGASLGLVFTPPMVIFWLARCGWALRDIERRSNI